ncbi:MAG: phosphopentomutase [bacterium]|nr:phosphopentomutase [bacterium]
MNRAKPFRRILLIILDGVGVGELPDAANFGDGGSDSLGNVVKERGSLNVPNLCGLGLRKIVTPLDCGSIKIHGAYGKCAQKAKGKDSTGGHWELMGYVVESPFPLFPKGFPDEFIEDFERKTGRKVIGNVTASGTEIIEELGEAAENDEALIVYTSADSVFQIAAHVGVISPGELYGYCMIAREMLRGDLGVSRVIARPFAGKAGEYYRTADRRDFSLEPEGDTVLDALLEGGFEVHGVGKVDDLFAGRGFSDCAHITDNEAGVREIIELLGRDFSGLIFANLNDTDTKYGHRNDVEGYAEALEYFDDLIPLIKETLGDDDLLIITSDHGNDPTTESTDHSREYTPLLVWYRGIGRGVALGTRASFADMGKTILSNFGVKQGFPGNGFLDEILKD